MKPYQYFYIFCLMFVGTTSFGQSKIDTEPVNNIKLNTELKEYNGLIYLITGEEDIYQQHAWLKASVKRNIANGIREGMYTGEGLLGEINGMKAYKTSLIFFQNELYKVRWFFREDDYPDLDKIADQLNQFLTNKYGPVTEAEFLYMQIWSGEKNYVQTFHEEGEFQIEYRDNKINEIVEVLE